MKKTLHNSLTTLLLLCLLAAGFTACHKEPATAPVNPSQPPIDLSKLTDSAAYTVDGVTYHCSATYGTRWGNSSVLNDTTDKTFRWSRDTTQYWFRYTMATPGGGAELAVTFAKAYPKTQLTRNFGFGIYAPPADSMLYLPRGQFRYATDFGRFNSINGVALSLRARDAFGGMETLSTYSAEAFNMPTSIGAGSQDNSSFEVIKAHRIPPGNGAGTYILEIKFSANVFDSGEKLHRVKSGYMRIRVE